MVGVLIRMKLAVLRHSTTDAKMALSGLGWTAGICLAITTLVLASFDFSHPRLLMDLLAVTFALWALGWMAGPIFAGEPALNGEHFHRQPIPRRTLAMGLLAAALVATTTAITLVAFGALIVFAARLNWVAVVVSVPAVVLLLLLVVLLLLSRVVTLLFRSLARSRIGGAVTATVTAAMVSLCSFSWVLIIGVYLLLEYGFPPTFSTVVRALPSSWGLLAVEAAARGDWLWTVGPLVALAAVVVALFSAPALRPSRARARPTARFPPRTSCSRGTIRASVPTSAATVATRAALPATRPRTLRPLAPALSTPTTPDTPGPDSATPTVPPVRPRGSLSKPPVPARPR
ncbi:hypothetical protein WBG99_25920 [Streptomyces sp. TG1A-60]|uniref:hypothetical protein n=1 Tax=Streptomyces sp. TG1A-60 TaxID=3129111 RepID=UPI0030D2EDA4